MKNLLIIALFFSNFFSFGQQLSLPQRQLNAYNGTQFIAVINSLNLNAREDSIFAQIIQGNVPEFQRNLIPITINESINSVNYNLTYYVLPDYLAIGCDTNYFLCPMTPVLAQKICNYTNCMLPTRKMVNQIWNAATVKLSPSTIPPSSAMTTVPVFNQHNTTVWGQRSQVLAEHPLGELVGGDKKDVVISNLIYTSPSPLRVVIYGWHQLNGSPIQPLYAGHENFYADYSHGIRLVQKNAILNGVTIELGSILSSSSHYSLISDEGIITNPTYPLSSVTVSIPKIFAVISESQTSIKILVPSNPLALSYNAYLSNDGSNFVPPINLTPNYTTIDGLNPDNLYFVKIALVTADGESEKSELLAATTNAQSADVIIVNGFDRTSTGNTYNFIRQHALAFQFNNRPIHSATNEAITSGLISLNDYSITDYILGEESTADETFNNDEQVFLMNYVQHGGKLFISGSEIAWDLDYKGSQSDKDFYRNYLKAEYVYDAPNNQSNLFYSVSNTPTQIFSEISDFSFDNGNNGTYNVDYPDVIKAFGGSSPCMYYTGFPEQFAAICYEGIAPTGSNNYKLVNMGFPFETIYPESIRNSIMQKILAFFDQTLTSENQTNREIKLITYPNPFRNELIIEFLNPINKELSITMCDIYGKHMYKNTIPYVLEKNRLIIDTSFLPEGVYFLTFSSQTSVSQTKIIKY
jgi:hypothetical protein